jgi:hypothetical protein
VSRHKKAILCQRVLELVKANDEQRRGVDVAKKIVYGSHAKEKFEILRRHGFVVTKKQVRETLLKPDRIDEGFRGRKIAQRKISEKHVLRVVFVEESKEIGVVTFYPGRRSRYESSV